MTRTIYDPDYDEIDKDIHNFIISNTTMIIIHDDNYYINEDDGDYIR